MSEAEPTLLEVRDAFHKAVHERPGDYELIAGNYAHALFKLNVPATMMEACLNELNRRWKYAVTRTRKASSP